MQTLNEIIDAAVKAAGCENDSQLAKKMGITRQSVHNWRQKTSTPDMYALMELQKILKVDARELVATIEAERAKTEERRGYWEDIKKSFSTKGVASAVALATAIALYATPYSADAAELNYANNHQATKVELYSSVN